MGIVLVAFLAARIRPVPSCYHDDINLETHQLGRKLREPIALPLCISVFDGDVLSFYVAKLAQSQSNCLGTGGLTSCDRSSIDTLSAGLSSAAAPWPQPQRQRAQKAMIKAQAILRFSILDFRLSECEPKNRFSNACCLIFSPNRNRI